MTKEEVVRAIKEGVITLDELKEELEVPTERDKDNTCLMHILLCKKEHSETECKFYIEERLPTTWDGREHRFWFRQYKQYMIDNSIDPSKVSVELNLIYKVDCEIASLGHLPKLLLTYVHNINKANQ